MSFAELHACSPNRWKTELDETPSFNCDVASHSIVSCGTTFAFADSQLYSAELTSFQNLVAGLDIDAWIVEHGRFPDWPVWASLGEPAAQHLQRFVQSRRLSELLSGTNQEPCRAIVSYSGWVVLAHEVFWSLDDAGGRESPTSPVDHRLFRNWLEAVLETDSAPEIEDSDHGLRDLALCSSIRPGLDGSEVVSLTEKWIDGRSEFTAYELADALAQLTETDGRPRRLPEIASERDTVVSKVWRAFQARVSSDKATISAFECVLVAALNPPICRALLTGEEVIPDWNCLPPGVRFPRLCAAVRDLPRLDASGTVDDAEAIVDSLCEACGWPGHSPQRNAATALMKSHLGDAALADVFQTVLRLFGKQPDAEQILHLAREDYGKRLRSPLSHPSSKYLAFVDTMSRSRGGLVRIVSTDHRFLTRCNPARGLDWCGEPQSVLDASAIVAVRIARDLFDGLDVQHVKARVPPSFLHSLPDGIAGPLLAGVTRLPMIKDWF